MGAKTRQWALHLGLSALAAGLASLAHASGEGREISQADLLVALQTIVAYLAGAVLRSPLDARDPEVRTRAVDALHRAHRQD